jgi:hypothetical protein
VILDVDIEFINCKYEKRSILENPQGPPQALQASHMHHRHIMHNLYWHYTTFEGHSYEYYRFVVLLKVYMQTIKWQDEKKSISENPQAQPELSQAPHLHHRHILNDI